MPFTNNWLDGIFNEDVPNIETETFIYSKNFQGSINGYVFKLGEKGIGYYKDNKIN